MAPRPRATLLKCAVIGRGLVESERCPQELAGLVEHALFDHLVRHFEQGRWDREAEGFRRVTIDEKAESLRTANRDVSRPTSSQDLIDLLGDVVEQSPGINGVRDQPDLGGREHPEVVHHGDPAGSGDPDDVMPIEPRRAIAKREQGTDPLGNRIVEHPRQVFTAFPFGAMEAQASVLSCGLDVPPVRHPVRGRLV